MSIKIPDKYRPGLIVLGTLPSDAFDQVLASLVAAPVPPKGHKELNAWISSEVKSVTPPDLKSLIETLVSLYRLRIKYKVEPKVLAADVAEAASLEPSLKALSGDLLKDRLTQLLSLNSLDLVDAKAKELQNESERRFCEARIITDLRPVFGSNVSDSPDTMIIVHTLKLGFHDSKGKHRDIFVSLDLEDISQMAAILKRALDKTKAIKGKMSSVGIQLADI